MNKLTIVNKNGQLLVDSRQVADMVGKRHADLLESIKGYIVILTNGEFRSLDFFIESTYLDSKGEARPCYLITRKGCDMVANKMTGEKGVLFTAAYISTFYEMEKQLQAPAKSFPKPRKPTSRIRSAVKDALDTAEYIASKLGVKLGIAQAAAISMVEQNSDIKLGQLKGLLPSAEHETGHLNATNLGKLIASSAVDTNRLLIDKNLQYQESNVKGDRYYRLTDAGKDYGEEFPYERNGHCGYQIKWNESVLSILLE